MGVASRLHGERGVAMKAVMLEVPEALLAERSRLGIDGRDEMWNGVLHMVPPASGNHQRLAAWLLRTLAPAADEKKLVMTCETGLWAADDDYKVPDLLAAPEPRWSNRGVEVPSALVIEILSPGDETLEKIEWYSAMGVDEVVVIHRDTLVVSRYDAAGISAPSHDGWFDLRSLGGRVRGIGDHRLEVRLRDGTISDVYEVRRDK